MSTPVDDLAFERDVTAAGLAHHVAVARRAAEAAWRAGQRDIDINQAVAVAVLEAQDRDPDLWPPSACARLRDLGRRALLPASYVAVDGRRRGVDEPMQRWVRIGDYWLGSSAVGEPSAARLEWDQLEFVDRAQVDLARQVVDVDRDAPEPEEFTTVSATSILSGSSPRPWVRVADLWYSVAPNGRDLLGLPWGDLAR